MNRLRLVYDEAPGSLSYFFYTEGSKCVGQGNVGAAQADTDFYITVPEDAYMFCLVYTEDNIPAIYRAD